jgi:hypothetical protein
MFLTTMVYVPENPNSGPSIVGVRSGTGVVVVVVVVGGTVVVVVVIVVVVVVDGAAVVVVVVAEAIATAGAVGGHESASARGASLNVSTVAPTARAMTMARPRPTPRWRAISRSTMPVATRSNASVTNIEILAPVTGSWQPTARDSTAVRADRDWFRSTFRPQRKSVATGTERWDAL